MAFSVFVVFALSLLIVLFSMAQARLKVLFEGAEMGMNNCMESYTSKHGKRAADSGHSIHAKGISEEERKSIVNLMFGHFQNELKAEHMK